jgi:hypothetical protein
MSPNDSLLFDMPKVQTATFAKYKHPHYLPHHVLVAAAAALSFVFVPCNLFPTMNECLIRFDSTFIIYQFLFLFKTVEPIL